MTRSADISGSSADAQPREDERVASTALSIAAAIRTGTTTATAVTEAALSAIARIDVDVLIAAATPCPATPIEAELLDINGKRLALRASLGLLTQPLSCIGLPVRVAPIAQAGLPIGVQIIAAPWREDLCFRVAATLQTEGVAKSRCRQFTPKEGLKYRSVTRV